MIVNAYSIFDSKATYYNTPFFCLNHGVALRMFEDMANDASTNVFRHPEDFILYYIGQFDDSNCLVVSKGLTDLGHASTFKKPVPEAQLDARREIDAAVSALKDHVSSVLLSSVLRPPQAPVKTNGFFSIFK